MKASRSSPSSKPPRKIKPRIFFLLPGRASPYPCIGAPCRFGMWDCGLAVRIADLGFGFLNCPWLQPGVRSSGVDRALAQHFEMIRLKPTTFSGTQPPAKAGGNLNKLDLISFRFKSPPVEIGRLYHAQPGRGKNYRIRPFQNFQTGIDLYRPKFPDHKAPRRSG